MAQRVFTAFGPGRIVETETVRGRTSYRVAGHGYSKWLYANELTWDETPEQVNEDNTTTLPYDPTPQGPTTNEGFSTIQPGAHEIDVDERTSPSDSLSGNSREDSKGPGPSSDLFADGELGGDRYDTDTQLPGENNWHEGARVYEAMVVGADPADGRWVVIADITGDRVQTDSMSMAQHLAKHPYAFSGAIRERIVAGFQNPELAELEHRIRTSKLSFEAAWKDVRAKAVRLRREGAINVVDEDVKSIMAYVRGDHGTYETFVIRQGHLSGNSGISEWSCSCEWGHWAFKRTRSFVGRMCSHAYAAYLELQSQNYARKRRQHTGAVPKDYVPMGAYTDVELKMPKELHLEPTGFIPTSNDLIERTHRLQRVDLDDPKSFFSVQARREFIEAAGDEALIERLRELSEDGPQPQHQDEHNGEVAEVVQELRERGYDADQMVASLRREAAEPVKYTDMYFPETFAGSGPLLPLDIGTSEQNVKGDDHYGPRLTHQELGEEGEDTAPKATTKREMDKIRQNKQYKNASDDSFNYYNDLSQQDDQDLSDLGKQVGDSLPSMPGQPKMPGDGAAAGEAGEGAAALEELAPLALAAGRHYADLPMDPGGPDTMYGDNGMQMPSGDQMAAPQMSEDQVVANFQREAGWLMEGNAPQGNDDVAAAAQAFLRTAGRNYSFAEQQALIDEGIGQRAANLDDLDLTNTHYLG